MRTKAQRQNCSKPAGVLLSAVPLSAASLHLHRQALRLSQCQHWGRFCRRSPHSVASRSGPPPAARQMKTPYMWIHSTAMRLRASSKNGKIPLSREGQTPYSVRCTVRIVLHCYSPQSFAAALRLIRCTKQLINITPTSSANEHRHVECKEPRQRIVIACIRSGGQLFSCKPPPTATQAHCHENDKSQRHQSGNMAYYSIRSSMHNLQPPATSPGLRKPRPRADRLRDYILVVQSQGRSRPARPL